MIYNQTLTVGGSVIKSRIISAGLRPTRQRLLIAEQLFGNGHRHWTADALHQEILSRGEHIALATIYNTLNAFTEVGLLDLVSIEPGKVHYDTNTDPHFHLYSETEGHLTDLDPAGITISGLPDLPASQNLDRVDVIIRTRKAS